MKEPIVIPIAGEGLRFLVRSRSRPQIRLLVDLAENDCRGWCACEDHAFRILPALNRGEEITMCWHVRKAREWLLDQMLPKLARHLETHA